MKPKFQAMGTIVSNRETNLALYFPNNG